MCVSYHIVFWIVFCGNSKYLPTYIGNILNTHRVHIVDNKIIYNKYAHNIVDKTTKVKNNDQRLIMTGSLLSFLRLIATVYACVYTSQTYSRVAYMTARGTRYELHTYIYV